MSSNRVDFNTDVAFDIGIDKDGLRSKVSWSNHIGIALAFVRHKGEFVLVERQTIRLEGYGKITYHHES